MVITTKFELNQDCYLMKDNLIYKCEIAGLKYANLEGAVYLVRHCPKSKYGNSYCSEVAEKVLYPSLDALIEHLEQSIRY